MLPLRVEPYIGQTHDWPAAGGVIKPIPLCPLFTGLIWINHFSSCRGWLRRARQLFMRSLGSNFRSQTDTGAALVTDVVALRRSSFSSTVSVCVCPECLDSNSAEEEFWSQRWSLEQQIRVIWWCPCLLPCSLVPIYFAESDDSGRWCHHSGRRWSTAALLCKLSCPACYNTGCS